MTLQHIANIRSIHQQIAGSEFKTPKQVVEWMGAMQSQDLAMSKWAVGLRLPHSTDSLIQKAIDKGDIIRTHVLRPTWHLVSANDVHWMLELTAPQIKTLMRSRDKELGITEKIYTKTNSIIEKALSKNKQLTRDQLILLIEKAKIVTNDYRSGHFMLRAELDGIVCSGATDGNKQTYALLHDRVKKTNTFTKEESLARLAERYFTSHGPATVDDFKWWSGLSITDSKKALELVKEKFISESINGQTYCFSPGSSLHKKIKPAVHLLPAFDEYIISYKDRTATISTDHQKKAFTSNGIFKPTIIVNGHVSGLWKRTVKKDTVIIETEFLKDHSAALKALIKKSARRFGEYMEKTTEVIF